MSSMHTGLDLIPRKCERLREAKLKRYLNVIKLKIIYEL